MTVQSPTQKLTWETASGRAAWSAVTASGNGLSAGGAGSVGPAGAAAAGGLCSAFAAPPAAAGGAGGFGGGAGGLGDCGSSTMRQAHSRAPFFHAYTNPTTRMNRNTIISISPKTPS